MNCKKKKKQNKKLSNRSTACILFMTIMVWLHLLLNDYIIFFSFFALNGAIGVFIILLLCGVMDLCLSLRKVNIGYIF